MVGPVGHIPWLTAADFPLIVINILRPREPNKICSICRWQL